MDFFNTVEYALPFLVVLFISIIAIVIATISYFKYKGLRDSYDNFMSGRDAESLEEFFLDIQSDIDHLLEDHKNIKSNIKALNRITKKSYQKFGIYRYDAFEEKGGKRSFTISLLDYTNTGFIVTCQNTGSGTLLFIKEVEAGATRTKLGPEEESALEIAMGQKEKDV